MKQALPIAPGHDGLVFVADPLDQRRMPHCHEELEMNLVRRGSGTYLIGDRRVDLVEHAQIWLFPEQNHTLVNKSRDFEMWVVYYERSLVERICTTEQTHMLLRRDPGHVFSRHLNDDQVLRVSALLSEIKDSVLDVPLYNTGLAYSLLVAWHEFSAAQMHSSGNDVHPAVERAAFLIRDQVGLRGIDELAHQAGLSPSRLSRVFRRQMGVSIVAYWNRHRFERFLELYADGARLSMTQAALNAGFGSYPQFYRVFREHVGCGPAEYRRHKRLPYADESCV
jgi:AraC-like DNA-binding protein